MRNRGVDTKKLKNVEKLQKEVYLKPRQGLKDFLLLQKLDDKVVFER